MKQENRLVAELYRYLAPFIDTTKDIYICLDGQAAEIGVLNGTLIDPVLPDMFFYFVGQSQPTLMEAKIIEESGHALLMQSQLSSWRTTGTGKYKPKYWFASNRAFSEFYLWTHEEFLHSLDNSKALGKTLKIKSPVLTLKFKNIVELAIYIIKNA